MPKPRLPKEIEYKFPVELAMIIYSFVPSTPKKQESPSLHRELDRIQKLNLKGKNEMYLFELIDFVLD